MKGETRKSGWVAGTFGVLFFPPYLLIYVAGLSEWFARLLATGYFLILGSAFGIMAANMRAPIVREGSKLAQLNMPRTRAMVEWGFRGAFLLVAIIVLFSFPKYVKRYRSIIESEASTRNRGPGDPNVNVLANSLNIPVVRTDGPDGTEDKMPYGLFAIPDD